jgi:predicted CoA-binding protein
MSSTPKSVAEFLSGSRLAVAGVSRTPNQAANAIYRKLKTAGFEVLPINPKATALEGEPCYPDVASLPGTIDGVVIATHPDAALDVVRQCAERGIGRVWFHRSFGQGSVSEVAVAECDQRGIEAIVGGCPLMFCEPVDVGHKCMRWWLQRRDRVPR